MATRGVTRGRGRRGASGVDLSTAEGLAAYARAVGLGSEVDKILGKTKEPKLSVLQRLSKILGSFNPAEALLTGKEEGLGSGVAKYGTGVIGGIASGITGRDYEGERRYFKDVAAAYGIENKILKGGLGFVGDVLLDPTTYFGGAIVRGIGVAAKTGGRVALKGVGKISPMAETGLRMTTQGLQDAFGKAFVAGYKATRGAKEDLVSALNIRAKQKLEIASQQMANLGVKGLTKDQRLQVGLKTALGKQSEYLLGENIASQNIDELKKLYPELGIRNIDDVNRIVADIQKKPQSILPESLIKDLYKTKYSRVAATEMIEQAQRTGNFSKIKAIDENIAKNLELKFDTRAEQEYFKLQQERMRSLSAQVEITDPYAIYFPYIRKDKINKFLIDLKRRGIRVGSEDYRKEFKNLLKIDNIIKDPAQAFYLREAQITDDIWARETLQNFANKYGKPMSMFRDAVEARANGFAPLKLKGGFGEQVGWVQEWDKKLFDDLINPEFQTINMIAGATGFDALTSLFKRSVTGLFLPFHVRNWVSGMIQNYETLGPVALNPRLISAGNKMAYKIAKNEGFKSGSILVKGIKTDANEVMQKFVERFGYGESTFIEDMAQVFGDNVPLVGKTFTKERALKTLKTVGLGKEGIPFTMGRRVGQFIEVQQKTTAYLAALSQGKSIREALDIATTAGFDYRVLTQFESQIMRRLIPFYSFTRKNIELQLKTLGENPQRINQIIRLIENIGAEQSLEDRANLPDYLKQTLGISLGRDAESGLNRYVSSFGTPIEAFTQLFKPNVILNVLSQTNPLLKTPIELGVGKDSFRQKDLKDVYDAKEYSDVPKVLKDLLGIKEVVRYKYRKVGDKLIPYDSYIQYVADEKRLLIARSLFTSRGFTYLDNIFDSDVTKMSKFINLFTGIKAQPIDPDITSAIKEKEMQRALEDLLLKYTSNIRKYQSVYIKK